MNVLLCCSIKLYYNLNVCSHLLNMKMMINVWESWDCYLLHFHLLRLKTNKQKNKQTLWNVYLFTSYSKSHYTPNAVSDVWQDRWKNIVIDLKKMIGVRHVIIEVFQPRWEMLFSLIWENWQRKKEIDKAT